ncbi:MAG: hypothetical protein HC795_05655 [Coleofasciculaceae cyanobacterium RL_1_1]|nr:hypothetical protein [Coleofasciculaceae cyanobacterium RL_1_1]
MYYFVSMPDPDGLTIAQRHARLNDQIQLLIDRAPQDGRTPIALRAIAPALIALAQQLGQLQYYVLQSRDGNWLLTTLQNNDDPELEKAVVYGFPSIDDARSSLKSPVKPDLVAVAMPIAQILFQLLAFDRVDSAIFFDRAGSRERGIEIQRSELQQLANAHLQKLIAETQAANQAANPAPPAKNAKPRRTIPSNLA